MSTPPTERRRRRGLPLLITGVALVGAVVGGVVVSSLNNPDPVSTPTSTATTPPTATPVSTPTSSGTGYAVEAGGGGTRVANADGKTPMGYPSTCEGAIAAATNYVAVMQSGDAASVTPEGLATFNALIDEISPGAIPGGGMWQDLEKESRARYAENYAAMPLISTTLPEVGAFRIVSCTPERAAEIDVVLGAELRMEGSEEVDRWYVGQRVQLTWLNDWSPRDISDLPGDEAIGLRVSPGDFSRSVRDTSLTGNLSDWQEYTNVPF